MIALIGYCRVTGRFPANGRCVLMRATGLNNIQNWSFWFGCKILCLTVWEVLRHEGES